MDRQPLRGAAAVPDDRWYEYNDSVVRPVSEEEVDTVSRKAYMLRFRKS